MSQRYQTLVEAARTVPSTTSENPTQRDLDPAQERILINLAKALWFDAERGGESADRERRRSERRLFPQMLIMTPCADLESPCIEQSEPIVAKDISTTGLSFLHSHQPRAEQVLITFPSDDRIPTCLLAKVRYTRAAKRGLYVVGIEFVQRVHLVSLESGGDDQNRSKNNRTRRRPS